MNDDRRTRIRIQSSIRIRIHTSDLWIQIGIMEAKKHVNPVDPDPDSDPDPQHWFTVHRYLQYEPDLHQITSTYVFRSGLRGIFWNRRHGLPSLAEEKERWRRERDARSLHSSTWQPTPWHLVQKTLRSAYFSENRTFSKLLGRFANPEFIISIPVVYFKISVL